MSRRRRGRAEKLELASQWGAGQSYKPVLIHHDIADTCQHFRALERDHSL